MEKLNLEDVLESVGGWGKFQVRSYLPLCCAVIFSVFHLNYIFSARDAKYRCEILSCKNDSVDQVYNPEWLKNAVPFKDNIPSRCSFYSPETNNTCFSFNQTTTERCSKFIFERQQTTIVQDFEIYCDENLWKLTIVGSINALGELFCLPFAGFLSDRFGRKRMIITSVAFSTAMGLFRSFAPWYPLYLVFEFLDMALGAGTYSGAFILALEIVDTNRRSLGNTIINFSFAIGQVILALMAWATPSWRILLRVIYSAGFLVIIALYFVPESVRWLVSKNKTRQAWKTLNMASKLNKGRNLDPAVLSLFELAHPPTQPSQIVPIKEVFKSKTMVLRIIHCSYTWLAVNFPYYGLTIQSVTLSSNIYLNFIFTALIEIPAYVLTQKVMDSIGRRKTLAASLILAGISCIGVYSTKNDSWIALAVFLCGKFFITVSYTTLYIYTAEMFPTECRHSIFSICSMCGRFGMMLAPQVPILERVFKTLPLIIFSVLSISSGILAFWFPETLNADLPEEVNEAVHIEDENT